MKASLLKESTYALTVRVPWPQLARLDSLAARTHRTRADVMRLLLAQATATEGPDILAAPIDARAEGLGHDVT